MEFFCYKIRALLKSELQNEYGSCDFRLFQAMRSSPSQSFSIRYTADRYPAGPPTNEVNHSPLSSAEVKNVWIYTSIHPYTFMV
jgi:hypothetical protein